MLDSIFVAWTLSAGLSDSLRHFAACRLLLGHTVSFWLQKLALAVLNRKFSKARMQLMLPKRSVNIAKSVVCMPAVNTTSHMLLTDVLAEHALISCQHLDNEYYQHVCSAVHAICVCKVTACRPAAWHAKDRMQIPCWHGVH